MKKVLFTLILCLAGVITASAQAVISFDQTTHDFGTFSENSPIVVYSFKFKNSGNQPLVINQVVASCGCTVPTYTKQPIGPGQSGEIKVTYNGKGKFPGQFKKVITVQSNTKESISRLYIEGNMTAAK